MSLNLNFNFGRLLQVGERLTTARVNAIVRGISATITGAVGGSDLADGVVTATKATPDAYFYTENCTLVGPTYTLANGFPVDPPALVDGLILYFKADATNTGAVNLAVNALGTHTITKYGGQPLVAGDIVAEQIVGVQYNTSLLAQPTWQFIGLTANQTLPTASAVGGATRNLIVQNNAGTPASKVDIDADEVVLKSASGDPYLASAVNVTCNSGTTGADGLDTGVIAATTWYYLWLIYNPTTLTVASLLSLSATAPTMPAGYTFKALVSRVHAGVSGGSTTDFMTFYQLDQEVYLNHTNLFTGKAAAVADTYEVYSAGGGGADVPLAELVPPDARRLRGTIGCGTASANQAIAIAADANGLGAALNVAQAVGGGNMVDGFSSGNGFDIPLKTAQTFYWKTTAPQPRNRVSISGYSL